MNEDDYMLEIFILFEDANALALGKVDVDLVVGASESIVHNIVLERYLEEEGIHDGPYSTEHFHARAAEYPEVHQEVAFQCCILKKLEATSSLAGFRQLSKVCSDESPLLWKIAC